MSNRRKAWCMYPMAVVAMAGAVTVGCGPGVEGGDGSGGTGAGSGTGGAGAGSGTGGAGGGITPAQGAFSLSFLDPGANCAIASHTIMVGEVDGQMANVLVTDGVSGADINCSVVDTGQGNFAVSATILYEGRFLEV